MDPAFNKTEDLGMSQTWINQSDPNLQEHDDVVFACKPMEDDVSLATSRTTATTSTRSNLLQESCLENLDFLHDDNKSRSVSAQEEKRSINTSRQTTTTKLNKRFRDIRSEARHVGMDGTFMRPPSSLGHKTTRKLSKSFSDIRSHFGLDGTMHTPSRRSTRHKTTAKLSTSTSFSDLRSETRHHISRDGTVMPIASKAHVDPEFKLAARRLLSTPTKNLQGRRGRRPNTRASASDLLRNIEKAPAVLRTRSMEALTVNRHSNEEYLLVTRYEVRSAIDAALAAYKDNHHKEPSSPLDSTRSSDFKVQHNARTPSFDSPNRSVAGQTIRVSKLAMKVKASRESFQKLMDESIESDFELSERNTHHNARFEHIQETAIEQQLREKDEQIKKLSRQLQDAIALNQEKDLEIKRRKSVGTRSRMTVF